MIIYKGVNYYNSTESRIDFKSFGELVKRQIGKYSPDHFKTTPGKTTRVMKFMTAGVDNVC